MHISGCCLALWAIFCCIYSSTQWLLQYHFYPTPQTRFCLVSCFPLLSVIPGQKTIQMETNGLSIKSQETGSKRKWETNADLSRRFCTSQHESPWEGGAAKHITCHSSEYQGQSSQECPPRQGGKKNTVFAVTNIKVHGKAAQQSTSHAIPLGTKATLHKSGLHGMVVHSPPHQRGMISMFQEVSSFWHSTHTNKM